MNYIKRFAGCKEGQFSGLLLGKLLLVCTSPKKFLISSIEYSFSVI